MNDPVIRVSNLKKHYGSTVAVEDVSLGIPVFIFLFLGRRFRGAQSAQAVDATNALTLNVPILGAHVFVKLIFTVIGLGGAVGERAGTGGCVRGV